MKCGNAYEECTCGRPSKLEPEDLLHVVQALTNGALTSAVRVAPSGLYVTVNAVRPYVLEGAPKIGVALVFADEIVLSKGDIIEMDPDWSWGHVVRDVLSYAEQVGIQ